jgi:hypothetical protein
MCVDHLHPGSWIVRPTVWPAISIQSTLAVIERHGLVRLVEAPGSRAAHGVSGFRAFTITDVATWSCCSEGSARRIRSITSSVKSG